jgi:transketolase
MVHRANASHVGSCLSIVDLLAVLYSEVLRVDPAVPDDPSRDRFVLSKGHAAAAVYATLATRGFFPEAWLETYGDDGGRLAGHLTRHGAPGVEVSTGSLGHGLPIACGMALAGKRLKQPQRVFCLLSDGECDEGSTWETALFAPHHRLDNLVAIIDSNRIQSFGRVEEVLDLEPFADKWKAFGWSVAAVNGHQHAALRRVFAELPLEPGRPTAIIAHTVKGKGVPFMEDRLEWHYRSPDARQLEEALEAVEAVP